MQGISKHRAKELVQALSLVLLCPADFHLPVQLNHFSLVPLQLNHQHKILKMFWFDAPS